MPRQPCFAMLTLVPGMRPRNLVFITMLALCHLQIRGQALTNAAPPAAGRRPSQAPPSPACNSGPLRPLCRTTPARRFCPWPSRSRSPQAVCRWSGRPRTRAAWATPGPLPAMWWSTTATTFCAPTRSSITNPPRSWRRKATCRSPADPTICSSTPITAICG
jgi:hypothetical protein